MKDSIFVLVVLVIVLEVGAIQYHNRELHNLDRYLAGTFMSRTVKLVRWTIDQRVK